jgi:hypothetical protein
MHVNGLGQIELSEDCYRQSVQIKEEIGDKRGLGATYVNMGVFYEKRGNNMSAFDYYKKAI